MDISSEATIVNVNLGEITMSDEERQKHEENLKSYDEKTLDKLIKKTTKEDPIYTINKKWNIFNDVIGPGYGQRIAKIVSDGIVDRFTSMASLVSYADQDDNLPDGKKKLIHALEEAFEDAICVHGPSVRLMKLIDKEPNLGKVVESEVRKMRMYDDLQLPNRRLQMKLIHPVYLPAFFTTMAMCYGWKNLKIEAEWSMITGRKYVVGQYFTALLSSYAKKLHPNDYVNTWFVAMVMKNLSVCSLTKKEVIEVNPQLMDYANNFFEVIDYMIAKAKHKLPREVNEEDSHQTNTDDNVIDNSALPPEEV